VLVILDEIFVVFDVEMLFIKMLFLSRTAVCYYYGVISLMLSLTDITKSVEKALYAPHLAPLRRQVLHDGGGVGGNCGHNWSRKIIKKRNGKFY